MMSSRPAALLRLFRPLQWSKNSFVLVGALFAHRWDADTLGAVALAFVAFCCMASAVYVFNDLHDLAADRAHPVKRLRPLASGEVSTSLARWCAPLLATVGLALAASSSLATLAFVALYGLLNVAYSLKLKHVVIVDVFSIAAGFMLRILAGTLGVGIPPSSWLLVCGLMLTLFLGVSKRSAEWHTREAGSEGTAREVLGTYHPAALAQFQSITATATILTYALYTLNAEAMATHRGEHLVYTVPVVTFGIFRYMHLVQTGSGGEDPARDFLRDPSLLATVLLWLAATAWIVA